MRTARAEGDSHPNPIWSGLAGDLDRRSPRCYNGPVMADYDFHELKHTKVADLRKIAGELDPPIEGRSQLNKDQLLERMCKQLGIEMHEHHEVTGIDKAPIKRQIRELKKTRDEALAAKDRARSRDVRQRIHRLKRTLRAATT